MEHQVFHESCGQRFWKATFPNQAGFGPAGYSTPVGYLHRLRLSNRIFGDDVRFEGIWEQRDGPSIVTSQRYILPEPGGGMPKEDEVESYLTELGFTWNEKLGGWIRDEDEALVQDAHPRNFIKSIDGLIYAIDVQPRLPKGREIGDALSHPQRD